MKKLMLAICLVSMILVQGCTGDRELVGFHIIGPYIADITYDSAGNMIITKEQIKIFAPEHLFDRTSTTSVIKISQSPN